MLIAVFLSNIRIAADAVKTHLRVSGDTTIEQLLAVAPPVPVDLGTFAMPVPILNRVESTKKGEANLSEGGANLQE